MALQTPPTHVRPVTGTHVVRVQHEGIVTADPERSKDFYCRVLGFQVLPRPAFKSGGYWLDCKPTDTIWFYEHRYPEAVKSYSKTTPLRVEEFDPIVAWWGKESNGFKDRVETEHVLEAAATRTPQAT
jgi:catechol 2,3-dioxygenase-like lactoylglutathione lyase family enzyme